MFRIWKSYLVKRQPSPAMGAGGRPRDCIPEINSGISKPSVPIRDVSALPLRIAHGHGAQGYCNRVSVAGSRRPQQWTSRATTLDIYTHSVTAEGRKYADAVEAAFPSLGTYCQKE